KLTGISFSHLSKIERGEHIPSKTTLDILSKKLDLDKGKIYLMAGYVDEENIKLPTLNDDDEEKLSIMKKIAKEFPDADLMFGDLASMDAEQLEEVYEFIAFKARRNKK